MAADSRFLTNALRIGFRDALTLRLTALTSNFSMADLMSALEMAGVPCGPVNTIDQVFEEPQAIARGLVVEQNRADLDAPVRTVASPMRMSRTPVGAQTPPPALGQDTLAVLATLTP
jgi:crotonobetainyl-CoA:carnitine CoA-transferase CaiB-like acyl-CoA transferase